MDIGKTLKRIRASIQISGGTAITTEFSTSRRMSRVLARERQRANRAGHEFSLIAFTLESVGAAGDQSARLWTAFESRLRCTDETGWLGSGRIGAVLPDTAADGAWKVADDVKRAFTRGVPVPHCDVYTYPADRLPGLPGDEETVPSSIGALDRERKVQPLESYFVMKVPMWKRAMDVMGSIVGLVLASPIILAAAVAVRFSSPGPVIFCQRRSGAGGRPFTMYKFRTMTADAADKKHELLALNEQDGPAFKIKNDPRITRVGRILRTTSIDELPQLWNVLAGDMSLVGPRPLPCEESEECAAWERGRLDVTPGLTCFWQVAARSSVSFEEWMRMDLRYIRSQSLAGDLKLLMQTVPAVVIGRGAQ